MRHSDFFFKWNSSCYVEIDRRKSLCEMAYERGRTRLKNKTEYNLNSAIIKETHFHFGSFSAVNFKIKSKSNFVRKLDSIALELEHFIKNTSKLQLHIKVNHHTSQTHKMLNEPNLQR